MWHVLHILKEKIGISSDAVRATVLTTELFSQMQDKVLTLIAQLLALWNIVLQIRVHVQER